MNILIKLLPDIGIRGRLAVCLMQGDKMVDCEHILKHPAMLRLRCRLAVRRMLRRQRKMLNLQEKLSSMVK